MTLRSDQNLLSVLQGAQLRFLNDERSGSVVVERTNDSHELSTGVIRRFARFARFAAPGSVLLLDEQDQLTGSGSAEELVKSEPARFGVVHAVCFPTGFSGSTQLVKRRQLVKGIWEVTLAFGEIRPAPKTESLELQVLQRWIEGRPMRDSHRKIRVIHSKPDSAQDDSHRDVNSPHLSPIERRIALRKQLRTEVALMTAEKWKELSGSRGKNPSAALGKHKAKGRLFAVTDDDRDFYPMFQFSEDAKPKPAIAQVLAHVPEADRGWPLLSWFNAGNVFLQDRRPMDVIGSDPKAVADAADRFFGRDD